MSNVTFCFFGRVFDCNRWLAVDEEDGKVYNSSVLHSSALSPPVLWCMLPHTIKALQEFSVS